MDYEVSNFQEDVIEASSTKPVLVDFWAPWCGPCRVLGPTLERLADDAGEKWSLVKVNTDQHPDVSSRYGIRGIPAVKLFVDGEVLDEFTGALPEYAVKQWLEKAIPSESKKRVDRAEREVAAGSREEARKLLEATLDEEPDNSKARVLLAQLLAFDDPQRAKELVSDSAFAGPGFIQIEDAVKTVARLYELDGELPDGAGHDAYRAGIEAMRSENFDAAVEKFIEVIEKDRYYDDDGARRACVALFTLLGNDHPAVVKHRRKFDMALY